MKKVLWFIACLMVMVLSVNAHNVHYPTYTIDGITYVMNGGWDGRSIYYWQVQKVHKPNDKTIVIPSKVPIEKSKRNEYSGEELIISNIGEEAFSECISLDSLIISDGISLDGSPNAFKGCKKLEYLYYSYRCYDRHREMIGLSCKTLETTDGCAEKPFWSAVGGSLEKLIIREASNLKSFYGSFSLCRKLKTIVCYKINPPSVYAARGNSYSCDDASFQSWQWDKITLYVPRESLEKYYFDRTWGEIDNIYAIDEMDNETTSINSINNSTNLNDVWYSLDGVKVDKPTKGVYIKNGKKYILTN